MSILAYTPRQNPTHSDHFGAFSQALVADILLEACTWLALVGTVSTVAASPFGSSAFTLVVAAAGMTVSIMRHLSHRPLTAPGILDELLTLGLVVAVINNPAQRGMLGVSAALLAWVVIEGLHDVLRLEITSFTTVGRMVILVGVAILVDGRTLPLELPTLLIMLAWVLLEAAWLVVDPRLFRQLTIRFGFTRKQKAILGIVGLSLAVLLVIQAISIFTTVRYYGTTASPDTLRALGKGGYCLQEPWIVAGLDLSFLGLNPMRCFDTEAEWQQALEQRHPNRP